MTNREFHQKRHDLIGLKLPAEDLASIFDGMTPIQAAAVAAAGMSGRRHEPVNGLASALVEAAGFRFEEPPDWW